MIENPPVIRKLVQFNVIVVTLQVCKLAAPHGPPDPDHGAVCVQRLRLLPRHLQGEGGDLRRGVRPGREVVSAHGLSGQVDYLVQLTLLT